MGSDIIKLRRIRGIEWALFAPKGHQLSNIFKGNPTEAMEWAHAFCSSYGGWTVQIEGEFDEQENRLFYQDVHST